MQLNIASKELWILFQNLTLLVIATIVFLGTIWPFIVEVVFNEQVSVDKKYGCNNIFSTHSISKDGVKGKISVKLSRTISLSNKIIFKYHNKSY